MVNPGVIVPFIFLGLVALLIIVLIFNGFKVVHEKEVIVVQRWGRFNRELHAGFHFVFPIMENCRVYPTRFWVTAQNGYPVLKQTNSYVLSIQSEVMDFPAQKVITRDNAAVVLDAVLNYKVVNAQQMVYSVENLPNVLSKLLQAQLRNVAGSLEIDQIIEDSATLNVLTTLMDSEVQKWGVKVNFVKVQKVEAPGLQDVLEKKKNADLNNKEIIIQAKQKKQTRVIEAEGQRDSMIKRAEGDAHQLLANAKGEAQSIINAANAEAKSIKEVARAIAQFGDNPGEYLLALKYIDALKKIMEQSNTSVQLMPEESAYLMAAQAMGLNTVVPRA